MKYFVFAFVVALLLISPKIANAQVLVNEISPASSPEWVELYKTEEGAESLEGCVMYLHNDTSSSQKVEFTAEDTFGEDEKYKQVYWKGEDKDKSWLNNDGDTVILVCSWGQDQVSFGSDVDDKTYGRSPDGSSTLNVLQSSTPGAENSGFKSTPTPSPSPTPEPSDSPTPEPTKSATPKPSKSPTPKPTNRVSASMGKSVTPTPQPTIDVLGENTTASPPSDDLKLTGEIPENSELPFPAIAMIGGGVITVGAAGVSIWKNRYNERTTVSSENGENEALS